MWLKMSGISKILFSVNKWHYKDPDVGARPSAFRRIYAKYFLDQDMWIITLAKWVLTCGSYAGNEPREETPLPPPLTRVQQAASALAAASAMLANAASKRGSRKVGGSATGLLLQLPRVKTGGSAASNGSLLAAVSGGESRKKGERVSSLELVVEGSKMVDKSGEGRKKKSKKEKTSKKEKKSKKSSRSGSGDRDADELAAVDDVVLSAAAGEDAAGQEAAAPRQRRSDSSSDDSGSSGGEEVSPTSSSPMGTPQAEETPKGQTPKPPRREGGSKRPNTNAGASNRPTRQDAKASDDLAAASSPQRGSRGGTSVPGKAVSPEDALEPWQPQPSESQRGSGRGTSVPGEAARSYEAEAAISPPPPAGACASVRSGSPTRGTRISRGGSSIYGRGSRKPTARDGERDAALSMLPEDHAPGDDGEVADLGDREREQYGELLDAVAECKTMLRLGLVFTYVIWRATALRSGGAALWLLRPLRPRIT